MCLPFVTVVGKGGDWRKKVVFIDKNGILTLVLCWVLGKWWAGVIMVFFSLFEYMK